MERCKISKADILNSEYDWFEKLFPLAMQKSADGFFMPGLQCELMGISKNINLLQSKEGYFVTKIKIDKFYDMFLRISAPAVSILLNKGLGRISRAFNINKLTELEANVMTAFNDYVYKIVVQFLEPPPVVNFKRTNFDVTHVTFLIKDEEGACGKFIISVPDGRMKPNKIETEDNPFEFEDFYKCSIPVSVGVGTTRFTIKDLKELEIGDMIVFENSRLDNFRLIMENYEEKIIIEPNMDLSMDLGEDGGKHMASNSDTTNLWDSIEVDMCAEFAPVKISLGDLKKIEQGLVVDVATLYDNKITLRVENKIIGHGELVIINDKYGVKVSDIVNEKEVEEEILNQPQSDEIDSDYIEEENSPVQTSEAPVEENQTEGEEEFDYSDFELEDEDI